jgi:hypothetical protein
MEHRDVGGGDRRIEVEDLLARQLGHRERRLRAVGVLPPLDREQRAMVRREPLAERGERAALRRHACQVALVAAAAGAEEILPDRSSEADHHVRPYPAPHARRQCRERQQLAELPEAHDRDAVERHPVGHRHPALADDEMHVVAAGGELVRELEAIPFGAAQAIVALVDERDPHSM